MLEAGIQFDLRFEKASPPDPACLAELDAWRRILYQTELIGRVPYTFGRWGGIGYGNLSRRVGPREAPPEQRAFVITGTLTGCLRALRPAHYTTVLECYPHRNLVVAEGPVEPSSESLTHGTLYGLDSELTAVMHVHSPVLWRAAEALGIPMTSQAATYGTPEMSREVERLFRDTDVGQQGIFAMGGHQDGLVSFGRSIEAAGTVLISSLARAYERAAELP